MYLILTFVLIFYRRNYRIQYYFCVHQELYSETSNCLLSKLFWRDFKLLKKYLKNIWTKNQLHCHSLPTKEAVHKQSTYCAISQYYPTITTTLEETPARFRHAQPDRSFPIQEQNSRPLRRSVRFRFATRHGEPGGYFIVVPSPTCVKSIRTKLFSEVDKTVGVIVKSHQSSE